jgi:hydrogenase maturation protease
MESPLGLATVHWDHEPVLIRSAGFPTGEPRRLESRRYGAVGSWKEREHTSNGHMSKHRPPSLLVIGYGNELRGDDAVGRTVAAAVEKMKLEGVRVLVCHQLTPELAEPVSQAGAVVLVDAIVSDDRTVQACELAPTDRNGIMTHAGDPRPLLGLARSAYGRCPRSWWITIPIERTTLGERLSTSAAQGAALAQAEIRKIWSRQRDECHG